MREGWPSRNPNRSGGKEHILIKVRKSDLARLFGVSKHTISSWARTDKRHKLDIRSLQAVCDKYFELKLKQMMK